MVTQQLVKIADIRKNVGKTLILTLENFQGVNILNMRVWYVGKNGNLRPGKQEIALRVEISPELLIALEQAKDEALQSGLIKGISND